MEREGICFWGGGIGFISPLLLVLSRFIKRRFVGRVKRTIVGGRPRLS